MKDKRSAPLCSGFHDLESTINDGRLFFNGFYALDGVKFAFRCNETGSGDHPVCFWPGRRGSPPGSAGT